MLYLLESGRALYVLAAVCILGIAARLTARSGYKRLQKECTNMALTKNRNLMELKQRAENTYRMNQSNMNTKIFVENQMYGFRQRGLPITSWSAFAGQMTWMTFLLGGVGAFYSYWYRLDSYYIVLYATGGLLLGMLSMLLDQGMGAQARRQQLAVTLTDYIDNTMITRLSRSLPEDGGRDSGQEASGGRRSPVRVLKRENASAARDSRLTAAQALATTQTVASQGTPGRDSSISGAAPERSRRDVDYLKRSLEQIAASREKSRAENEDWIKDLGPKEVELLGEILKEYLA